MPKIVTDLLQAKKHRNLFEYFVFVLCELLRRLCGFKWLRGMTLHPENTDSGGVDSERTGELVTAEQLLTLNNLVEADLSTDFIREAFDRGDWCYAFIDGSKLSSYGWYSEKPSEIDSNFKLNFSDDYIYMYKGFTALECRGQRLHAIGMLAAAQIAVKNNKKGLISYVEAGNVRSLHSCARLGYKTFGSVFLFKFFGSYNSLRTPGCAKYQFDVIPLSEK